MPIQVIRTYDSRDKRKGDFGIGWTLGIKNVRLEKSSTLGKLWDETVTPGVLPKYCLEPTRPQTVTITFPDGKQYRFNVAPSPSCQLGGPINGADITYVQIAGDSGTGGATLTAVGNNSVIVDAPVPGIVNLINLNNQQIYNPTRFQLTTAEKYVYVIDQILGVVSMTDPNGNTLTINSNGIIHSSGKSIVFNRDSSGRISKVTDPSGSELNYSYNLAGDLASFTDREGNTTNFSYNATHGLLTIMDPRGIQPIRNDYDADGRLVSHTDAFNHVITYTHSLATNHEEISDRLGHTTAYEYDANGNVLRLTDAQSHTTTYTYDDRDNKLTETNAIGKTTTFTYDAKDNLASQTDPLGNVTRYTYNDLRQMLTVTDPRLGVTTNVYDFKGNLTSTQDAMGNTTSFTYLPSGVRDTMTDALGKVTRYEYAGFMSPTKETDALAHATSFAYDTNGNRTSQTTTRTLATGATETLTTSFEYDLQNRLKKTIYADGTSTQVVYNSIGQQVATIDQLGRQTSYEYDSMGRMTRTTYPDTTSESSAYDAEGRRLTSTDRAGRVTMFEYDEVGRLKKTTYVDGTFTTTAYDTIGRVSSTTDARGNTTSYGYDSANRRISVTDALTHSTSFAYDANGNQASMTDANGHVMSYEYDVLNRRTKTNYADSTFDQTGYDSLGRVISKTDQAGKLTQYGYDALGRLIRVTDALNQITQYGYDEIGNQITQTDALGRITKFEYDKLGRRTKRTLPLNQVETYTYNSAGNLLTRRDFNAKTTTYAYDSMSRLLSKTPDASFAAPAVTFAYSLTGRRLTMNDSHGVTSYSYDNRDRLLSKATPEGTLSYTYDNASDVLTLRSSNANGVSVDYGYDTLNRLSTVTGNASGARTATGTTTYRYDDVGNLAGYLYPNAVDTSYTYNTLNRLTSMTLTKASTSLASFTYELGAAGNRTAVTELNGRHVDYNYDALYRMKSESIGLDPVTANNGAINYTYDAVGNRLNRTSTVAAVSTTTSTFNGNDQLGSDAYDANGNTTTSAGKTYVYDFENRIKSVNSGQTVFVYDGDGNRVAKTIGGVTTKFLVDTNNPSTYAQVVEEIVGTGVQRAYVQGDSLISQTQVISGNWATSFYGYDGHGSVRFLTDATGAITDTYTYDAFGSLIASTGATPNTHLYAGEEFDPNLGFYYLRARYMNPSSGRFWTMDLFEGRQFDPVSLHKYEYAGNEPVGRRDPSGQDWDLKTSLIVVGVIAVLAAVSAYAILGPRLWGGKSSVGTLSIISFNWSYLIEHDQFFLGNTKLMPVEIDEVMSTAETETQRAFAGFGVKVTRGGAHEFEIRMTGYSNQGWCGSYYPATSFAEVFYHNLAEGAATYGTGLPRSEVIRGIGRGIAATAAHEYVHFKNVVIDLSDPETFDYHGCDRPQQYYSNLHWSQGTLEEMKKRLPSP